MFNAHQPLYRLHTYWTKCFQLCGPHTKADDPHLVEAIKMYMIDSPRPYLAKYSYNLYETPQAKAAMDILKKVIFRECSENVQRR